MFYNSLSFSINNDSVLLPKHCHFGTILLTNAYSPIHFLIDTDYLQANVINERVEEEIRAKGGILQECKKKLCSYNNICVGSSSVAKFVLSFANSNSIISNINLECTVSDSSFDLIIGLPDIRKHNLLMCFPDHYFTPNVGGLFHTDTKSCISNSIVKDSMQDGQTPENRLVTNSISISTQSAACTCSSMTTCETSINGISTKDTSGVGQVGTSEASCQASSPESKSKRDVMIGQNGLTRELDDGDEYIDTDTTPWDHIVTSSSNSHIADSTTVALDGAGTTSSGRSGKSLRRKVTNGKDTSSSSVSGDTTKSFSSFENVRIEGPPDIRSKIVTILGKYKDIFSNDLGHHPAKVTPMDIKVDVKLWCQSKHRAPPRVVSEHRTAVIIELTRKMVKDKLIEPSDAAEHSQVLLTPKSDGTFRFCIDYRFLNLCTAIIDWPLPNIEQLIRRLGARRAVLFAKFDFTHGYYQAPLAVSSRRYTAFTTAIGKYHWLRVPMGLKGAPSYFQKVMSSEVLSGLVHSICELYIDDLLVYGTSESEI